MASLDKSTVRNEVSRLKDDFEQLCADGKVTSESKVLMNSMFMIKVFTRTGKKLNHQALVNLQKRYRNILTRGYKELPPIPPNLVASVES